MPKGKGKKVNKESSSDSESTPISATRSKKKTPSKEAETQFIFEAPDLPNDRPETQPILRDRKFPVCHRCHYRKRFVIRCRKDHGHSFCAHCIRAIEDLSWEDAKKRDPMWPDGCYLCQNTCICKQCRVSRGEEAASTPRSQSSRKKSTTADGDTPKVTPKPNQRRSSTGKRGSGKRKIKKEEEEEEENTSGDVSDAMSDVDVKSEDDSSSNPRRSRRISFSNKRQQSEQEKSNEADSERSEGGAHEEEEEEEESEVDNADVGMGMGSAGRMMGGTINGDQTSRISELVKTVTPIYQTLVQDPGAKQFENVIQIPRYPYTEFTTEMFDDIVLRQRIPVILEHANAHWDRAKWSTDYLREKHADQMITVRYMRSNKDNVQDYSPLGDSNKSLKSFVDLSERPEGVDPTADPDFDAKWLCKVNPSDRVAMYAKDLSFSDFAPELKEDLVGPKTKLPEYLEINGPRDLLRHLPQEVKPIVMMGYVGTEGTRTPLHVDKLGTIAFNLCVSGTGSKRWWIVHDDDRHALQHALKTRGIGDLYEDNLWIDPVWVKELGLRTYEAEQKEGDLVLVPPGTPHWVLNSGPGISFAVAANLMTQPCLATSWAFEKLYRRKKQKSIYRFKTMVYHALKNELEWVDEKINQFRDDRIMRELDSFAESPWYHPQAQSSFEIKTEPLTFIPGQSLFPNRHRENYHGPELSGHQIAPPLPNDVPPDTFVRSNVNVIERIHELLKIYDEILWEEKDGLPASTWMIDDVKDKFDPASFQKLFDSHPFLKVSQPWKNKEQLFAAASAAAGGLPNGRVPQPPPPLPQSPPPPLVCHSTAAQTDWDDDPVVMSRIPLPSKIDECTQTYPSFTRRFCKTMPLEIDQKSMGESSLKSGPRVVVGVEVGTEAINCEISENENCETSPDVIVQVECFDPPSESSPPPNQNASTTFSSTEMEIIVSENGDSKSPIPMSNQNQNQSSTPTSEHGGEDLVEVSVDLTMDPAEEEKVNLVLSNSNSNESPSPLPPALPARKRGRPSKRLSSNMSGSEVEGESSSTPIAVKKPRKEISPITAPALSSCTLRAKKSKGGPAMRVCGAPAEALSSDGSDSENEPLVKRLPKLKEIEKRRLLLRYREIDEIPHQRSCDVCQADIFNRRVHCPQCAEEPTKLGRRRKSEGFDLCLQCLNERGGICRNSKHDAFVLFEAIGIADLEALAFRARHVLAQCPMPLLTSTRPRDVSMSTSGGSSSMSAVALEKAPAL